MDNFCKARYTGTGSCFNLGYKSFPKNVWINMSKKEFEAIVSMDQENQFMYNQPLAFLLNAITPEITLSEDDEPDKPKKRKPRKKKEKSE